MKFYKVPDILTEALEEVSFIHYQNETPSQKNKVLFSQNVISFVITGEKQIHFSGSPIKVQESIVLIKASNCLMSERKIDEDQPYSALLIFFDNSLLSELCIKYKKLITHKADSISSIGVVVNDDFLMMYRDFTLKMLKTNSLTRELKKLKLEELWVYLLQNYPEAMQPFLGLLNDNSEIHFKAVVEENRFANLTLEELAFLCNMSVSSFKRYFRKYYGSSPKKWFLKEKMHYAKLLLEQGDSPSAIYGKLGYKTLSNFKRAYKKYFENVS